MRRLGLLWTIGLAASLTASVRINAATIATLYNTGVNSSGNPLPDGSADPHYVLTQVPIGSGLGPIAYVVDQNAYPISTGDWLPDQPDAKWIAPTADQSQFPNATGSGNYDYRTTFDLTGFNPSAAVITGRLSSDNSTLDILINGVSTGITHTDQTNPVVSQN